MMRVIASLKQILRRSPFEQSGQTERRPEELQPTISEDGEPIEMSIEVLESLSNDIRVLILHYLETADLVSGLQASPRLSKGLDIAHILETEALPGKTVEDLVLHVTKWKEYQLELLKNYRMLIPDFDSLEPEMQTKAFRDFLKRTIINFTKRVAGAHSWYKHLPIGADDVRFEFYMDLTTNMYHHQKEGKWVEACEGDGTRFHYTWLPTKAYRDKFGFFAYREENCSRPGLEVHYISDEDACVPRYARSEPVHVTAAMHKRSADYNLYMHMLSHAVNQEDPMLVHGPIEDDHLTHIQSRFRGRKDKLKLPTGAATDLEGHAVAILSNWDETRRLGEPDALRNEIQENANIVVRRQQEREWHAMATSLHELCRLNFGDGLIPELEEVLDDTVAWNN